ncbi:hypothetical protein BC936DRAFT_144008 [Jimgerdemannia flammicorona]|uniref:Uncharacterized protein n=2 Tax=Jimgerdemannia flammicorona TaxID=994334 RepID=A0A433Q2A1_9FUNG|nr:hypothetical protein BC936DRAFT_144008 [Jimgerdemannia flammicorona]RUS23935.1 hypothetical protein BC938DRAFT_474377 [Jimgerdemannia flammicorona]
MVNLNSTHLTTSTTYKPGSPTSRPQPLLGKHPRTTGKALRLHRLANAYRGNWEQGALLLQAIQMNAGRPINERMIVETTKRILQAWEPSGVNAKQVSALIRFVRHFVDNTAFPRMADMSLERAIGMLCVGSEAVPVVCPTIAMAVAMGYIERLRKVGGDGWFGWG